MFLEKMWHRGQESSKQKDDVEAKKIGDMLMSAVIEPGLPSELIPEVSHGLLEMSRSPAFLEAREKAQELLDVGEFADEDAKKELAETISFFDSWVERYKEMLDQHNKTAH